MTVLSEPSAKASLPFDADNHYYETLDAFTRHQQPEFRHRGVQVLEQGNRRYLLAGGRSYEFVPNPTFDPVIVPGCIDLMFRGQVPEGVDPRDLMKVEPLRAEYQNRDKRIARLDAQGLGAALLFPTAGMGIEEALADDVEATMATLHAFNRWLEDDWGYAYQDRLFAAPILSLSDPEESLKELNRVLELGARLVVVRPAPVPAGNGRTRSLGDKVHDPIWARFAAAGVPAAFHLGDSGYNSYAAAWGGTERLRSFRDQEDPQFALSAVVVSDRAIQDALASLVIGGVFTRHPTLRIASIENGSDWIHVLLKHLRKQANQTPWVFAEDPAETLRRHLWVAPYYEEDIRKLADTIGTDKVLFGSDWPHGEGLADPLDFEKELHGFSNDEVHTIMCRNVRELLSATS
jgi:predicted TIM-barrel fold metal-dependent hydrolase